MELSKAEIQDLAEAMSFQELSSLADTDPKMLDIFLSAVVAEEQADIAKSKNEKSKRSLDAVQSKSNDLWSTVEQKKKVVAHIIDESKKAIGEAIENMEALEQVRNSTDLQMKSEMQAAIEAKQNSEADLRRANEIMAMSEIKAEKAAEALKKAIEERDEANADVEKARSLIKGADFQLKVNEENVVSTKENVETQISLADIALKDAIESSFELEVKSAAEIEESKMVKSDAEAEATQYDEVLELKKAAFSLSNNVATRALSHKQQVMVEACTLAATLQKKVNSVSIAEEMLVETQVEKVESVPSSTLQIEKDSDVPLEENEVMSSLLARLDAIKLLNPANE